MRSFEPVESSDLLQPKMKSADTRTHRYTGFFIVYSIRTGLTNNYFSYRKAPDKLLLIIIKRKNFINVTFGKLIDAPGHNFFDLTNSSPAP
jgi:hypothetical protein